MRVRADLWTYVRNAILFQLVGVPACIAVSILIDVASGAFPNPHMPTGAWLLNTFKIFFTYGITAGLALSLFHTWLLSRLSPRTKSEAIRQSMVCAGGLAVVQAIPLIGFWLTMAIFILFPASLVYGWVVGRRRDLDTHPAPPRVTSTGSLIYIRNILLFEVVGVPVCIAVSLLINGVLPGRTLLDPSMHFAARLVSAIKIFYLYGITAGLALSLFHTWLLSRLSPRTKSEAIRQSMVCAGGLAIVQAIPLFFLPSITPLPVLVSGALAYGWMVGWRVNSNLLLIACNH